MIIFKYFFYSDNKTVHITNTFSTKARIRRATEGDKQNISWKLSYNFECKRVHAGSYFIVNPVWQWYPKNNQLLWLAIIRNRLPIPGRGQPVQQQCCDYYEGHNHLTHRGPMNHWSNSLRLRLASHNRLSLKKTGNWHVQQRMAVVITN